MSDSSVANMSLPKAQKPALHRILLVQSKTSAAGELGNAFQRNGFAVVTASSVDKALREIANQKFAALVCDLHIPAPGDGFTLVNAMRHVHPDAVTMILSDFRALQESMSALVLQADELLVTPVSSTKIVTLLKTRLREPRHHKVHAPEPVSTILERHSSATIAEWLTRVNRSKQLVNVPLSDAGRTGHLPRLLGDLVLRLSTPHSGEGTAKPSLAAFAHGKVRRSQGYSATMLVEESRILQVCIFKTLRNNLGSLDFSRVLTDVMTIADEVDSQLGQTMASFYENAAAQQAS